MRKLTNEGVEFYRNMVNGMLEIEHQTVWTGEPDKFFVFTTINPETATKAIAALKQIGVLCNTNTGSYEEFTFIEDLGEGN